MKKKILVVDDSLINRVILQNLLKDIYDVLMAENGQEALDVLSKEKENIEIILLDIVMPIMNGYQFLEIKNIKSDIKNIPVIVMTQKDNSDEEIKALDRGASDYLSKPYNRQVILRRIANIINLRENAAMINLFKKDPLTGVFTKTFLYEKIRDTLADDDNKKYDIICSDIENFRLVNDLFGSDRGDKLLKYVCETIGQSLSGTLLCGRVSADTFAFFVEHNDDYCEEMFENINRKINDFDIDMKIICDFGIYVINDRAVEPNLMCDRAIVALRRVKGHYGEFFSYYDASLRQEILDEKIIIDNMEQALNDNQFVVYFQPKYSLESEKICGAEALVRWIHPTLGFMSPGKFIPLFEKNGFITKLDYFVWEATCKKIKEWKDKNYTIVPVSVNVSRADIYNPHLVSLLLGLLKKYDIDSSYLHLEITETAYTQYPEQIIQVVDKLKQFGFIIEMDDFGTGYSSLTMLNDLPIDILKLDMAFIQKKATMDNMGILQFIFNLAKLMKLKVIAEGVETQEQVQRLKTMACDYVQGYFYAKPMKSDEFENLIK